MKDKTNENGKVLYNKSIVNEIVDLALVETDGIYTLNQNNSKRKAIAKKRSGVKINLLDNNVYVDVSIVVDSNFNVPNVACAIQENIKCRIESMTSYKVKEVNVNVLGVEFNQ